MLTAPLRRGCCWGRLLPPIPGSSRMVYQPARPLPALGAALPSPLLLLPLLLFPPAPCRSNMCSRSSTSNLPLVSHHRSSALLSNSPMHAAAAAAAAWPPLLLLPLPSALSIAALLHPDCDSTVATKSTPRCPCGHCCETPELKAARSCCAVASNPAPACMLSGARRE